MTNKAVKLRFNRGGYGRLGKAAIRMGQHP